MKGIVTTIIIWVACGIFNWNVYMADFCHTLLYYNKPRDHCGVCLFLAFTGPFSTLISPFWTNIYEHGFYYDPERYKRDRE